MIARQSKVCGYRRCTKRFIATKARRKYCCYQHAYAERNARTTDKVSALGKILCGYRFCEKKFRPRTTRQIYCTETCRLRENTEVAKGKPRHPKKSEAAKMPGKKCSCGCGDPVMSGLTFLAERCFKNKHNDVEDEHRSHP